MFDTFRAVVSSYDGELKFCIFSQYFCLIQKKSGFDPSKFAAANSMTVSIKIDKYSQKKKRLSKEFFLFFVSTFFQ